MREEFLTFTQEVVEGSYLAALESVAAAARAFASAYEPPDEELLDKTYYALIDALDELGKEE